MKLASSPTALRRFEIIRPFLEEGQALASIATLHGLSERTLRRWVAQYRENSLDGLERRVRSDKGCRRKIATELEALVRACALSKPPLPITALHRKVIVAARERQLPLPSYGVVYDIVRHLDPALVTLAQQSSKAYREKYELIHRREAQAPNAMWQIDHALLDILLLDETGEPRKPWLTGIIDDYSRALCGYFLSFETPCAINTALALRQAIWRKEDPRWSVCGIPQVLYSDNGSDFISEHIEQACIRLKIRLVHSRPGRPQGRGRIERLFRTITQKLLVDLPGYAPRSEPTSPPALELNAFTALFERFIHERYHCDPSAGTGIPPLQRWQAEGFLPLLPTDAEQLNGLLLRVTKPRTIQRDGIRFQSMRYIDPTLAAFVRERVEILYDPRDLAEIQVYFQGEFLCRAICQDIADQVLSLKDIQRARRHAKAERRRQIRAAHSLLEPASDSQSDPAGRDRTRRTRRLKLYRDD